MAWRSDGVGRPGAKCTNGALPLLPGPRPFTNVLLEMGLAAGARATEQRKHEENYAKCKELGWVCVPMVVEAYGAWGTEAMESLALMASRLATSSNMAKAVVLADLYGRLNLCLVIANAVAILSRCFVPYFSCNCVYTQ